MASNTITKIALAGNPNSGKTTLFNELTGSNQYVGNWPGVTVEEKNGALKGHENVIVQDLPGIYSLSPYSLEEKVSRNFLVNEKPAAILNIVDGTNIERNLYLTTQLAEIGVPMVVAINMMDLVDRAGDKIDFEKLGKRLNCKVVGVCAQKGKGCREAAELALQYVKERVARVKFPMCLRGPLNTQSRISRSPSRVRYLRLRCVGAQSRSSSAMQTRSRRWESRRMFLNMSRGTSGTARRNRMTTRSQSSRGSATRSSRSLSPNAS